MRIVKLLILLYQVIFNLWPTNYFLEFYIIIPKI